LRESEELTEDFEEFLMKETLNIVDEIVGEFEESEAFVKEAGNFLRYATNRVLTIGCGF
jgi:hypothetical protein